MTVGRAEGLGWAGSFGQVRVSPPPFSPSRVQPAGPPSNVCLGCVRAAELPEGVAEPGSAHPPGSRTLPWLSPQQRRALAGCACSAGPTSTWAPTSTPSGGPPAEEPWRGPPRSPSPGRTSTSPGLVRGAAGPGVGVGGERWLLLRSVCCSDFECWCQNQTRGGRRLQLGSLVLESWEWRGL